jgi:O-antigen/teichoic acid export membrane protein
MYKNIFNYSIAASATSALGLFTLPFYTRYLTPNDYGIIAVFLTYGTTVCTLLSFGLSTATTRYYFKYGNSEYFKQLNFSNLITILLSLVIFGYIASNFSESISKILFINKVNVDILNISIIFGIFTILQSYLTGLLIAQQRSLSYTIIIIFSTVIDLSLSVLMILLLDLTYFARIYSMIIVQVIMLIVLIFLQKNYFIIKFSPESLKQSLKFSIPNLPRELIGLLQESINKLMLANLQALTTLGFFQIGLNLGKNNNKLIKTVSRAWAPVFFNFAEDTNQDNKQKIVAKYYEVILLYAISTAFFVAFSEELVMVLTTVEFYPAMYIVPLVALNSFFSHSLVSISKPQIGFSEKMIYILPGSIASLIIHFSLNLIFIPIYGAIGAVISAIFAYAVANLITFYYGQKLYPLPIRYTILSKIFILFIFFISFTFYLMSLDILFIYKLLSKTLLLLIILSLTYYVVRPYLSDEVNIKKLIFTLKKRYK